VSDAIFKTIKEKDVQYVDLRFTDMRGKMQHVTFDLSMVDKSLFVDGTMFDGSSIAGWKAINESDMLLMPDPSSARIDPFFQNTTLAIMCDILNPNDNAVQPRSAHDGEEGGDFPQVLGRRRYGLLWTGSRVLCVLGRALEHRSQQDGL
jgi:glutamine synthetase